MDLATIYELLAGCGVFENVAADERGRLIRGLSIEQLVWAAGEDTPTEAREAAEAELRRRAGKGGGAKGEE